VKGRQAVGCETASRLLEATVALEKKFLEGRQNRAEELEGAAVLSRIPPGWTTLCNSTTSSSARSCWA